MKKYFTFLLLILLQGWQQLPAIPLSGTTLVYMKCNLSVLATDGTATLLDGDLAQYDPSFSNTLDGLDVRKMSNPGENIGMSRYGYVLAVERRQTIINTDTIFYKLWNLNSTRNYQLAFIGYNMYQPGLIGFVKDAYLNTNTFIDLNDTTLLNFSINSNPASYDPNRFTLIFTTPANGTLPIVFSSFKAFEENKSVSVEWQTNAAAEINQYKIERSTDGKNFSAIGQMQAKNLSNNFYNFTDDYPSAGYNYYRVASVSIDGSIKYSAVATVYISNGTAPMIKVFPNPVSGNVIHLQMINHPPGIYKIRLVNMMGKIVMTKELHHDKDQNENIEIENYVPRGIYQLEVSGLQGRKDNVSIYY